MDSSREWESESDRRFTPSPAAISAARPLRCSSGLWPGARRTSSSRQLTPRLMPVPSALAPASFAAKRAARLSAEFFSPCNRQFRRECRCGEGTSLRSAGASAQCVQSQSNPCPGQRPRSLYPFACNPRASRARIPCRALNKCTQAVLE